MEFLNEYIFGELVTLEELTNELKGATRSEGFGNHTPVKSYTKTAGAIDPVEVLNNLRDDDLKEDLKQGGADWIEYVLNTPIEGVRGDNTYNYNAPIANHFNFQTGYAPELDKHVAFIRVHVGLDVRAGYTNTAVLLYDNDYGFLEQLIQPYPLAEVEYTDSNGEPAYICIDGDLGSDTLYVYFTETGDTIESYVDTSDGEDLKEEAEELLQDQGIEYSDMKVTLL